MRLTRQARFLAQALSRFEPNRVSAFQHSKESLARIERFQNKFPLDDLALYPDFITLESERSLVDFIDSKLLTRRNRYQDSHFDSVIKEYREMMVDINRWPEQHQYIFRRVHKLFNNTEQIPWKPRIHVLDLGPTGEIGWHVDSRDYLGDVVAGICLLSDCTMKFRLPKTQKEAKPNPLEARALLERRLLYVQTGKVRYDYEHEIKHDGDHMYSFMDRRLPQGRRISLLIRDEKQQ